MAGYRKGVKKYLFQQAAEWSWLLGVVFTIIWDYRKDQSNPSHTLEAIALILLLAGIVFALLRYGQPAKLFKTLMVGGGLVGMIYLAGLFFGSNSTTILALISCFIWIPFFFFKMFVGISKPLKSYCLTRFQSYKQIRHEVDAGDC